MATAGRHRQRSSGCGTDVSIRRCPRRAACRAGALGLLCQWQQDPDDSHSPACTLLSLAHHGRVTQGPCSCIDPHTDLLPLHAHLQNSGSSDADYVRPAAKGLPKEITLYQYEVCPFCCKVKAALDFYKVGERCVHPAATDA